MVKEQRIKEQKELEWGRQRKISATKEINQRNTFTKKQNLQVLKTEERKTKHKVKYKQRSSAISD